MKLIDTWGIDALADERDEETPEDEYDSLRWNPFGETADRWCEALAITCGLTMLLTIAAQIWHLMQVAP